MKKTIILISSMLALCIISNVILMSLVVSSLFQKSNIGNTTIKRYYTYPNMYVNTEPKMAIPDEDIALEVGKIMLKQYLNVIGGEYKVSDMRYYWRIYVDNIVEDLEDGESRNAWVLLGISYVDFDKKDGRVLYAGYMETMSTR